jgi:hypothetical protein
VDEGSLSQPSSFEVTEDKEGDKTETNCRRTPTIVSDCKPMSKILSKKGNLNHESFNP